MCSLSLSLFFFSSPNLFSCLPRPPPVSPDSLNFSLSFAFARVAVAPVLGRLRLGGQVPDTCNPSTWRERQRQADREFRVILNYITSVRSACVTENPVSTPSPQKSTMKQNKLEDTSRVIEHRMARTPGLCGAAQQSLESHSSSTPCKPCVHSTQLAQ